MKKNKKKNKKKQRVLVEGPKVSDQSVLRKLDSDRKKVQQEIESSRQRESNIFGYPFRGYDLSQTVSAMYDMIHSFERKRKIREQIEASHMEGDTDEVQGT
jgi:hypothetical protein